MTKSNITDESLLLLQILQNNFPIEIDGKQAILDLQQANFQWKQMEWIGWYIEHKIFTLLTSKIGGSIGPQYGRTTFDYKKQFVWDFKAHPEVKFDGKPNEPMILNDKEAIKLCIQEYGAVSFIVVSGKAQFDTSGEFKRWHDSLKGETSVYEQERINRGAPSRIRKSAFDVEKISAICFDNPDLLEEGLETGWLTYFQEGMRNANGKPRRAKYAIKTHLIPEKLFPTPPVSIK